MNNQQRPLDIQPNTLGKTSLGLGIASASMVFAIGFCSLIGAQQGWLEIAGIPLLVCGASSAFLGFIGFVLGIAGLFGERRAKATAGIGLVLGLLGMCLFFFVMVALGQS